MCVYVCVCVCVYLIEVFCVKGVTGLNQHYAIYTDYRSQSLNLL